MNPIAPHNPPVQGPPGQFPTGGGRKDDTSFGDLLADSPPKGSPIDDHAPPPGMDEPASDDLANPPLPRPIRWKGGKGPAADLPGADAGTGVPLIPAQIDLRAIVPGVTLSGDWARPIVTPDDNNDGAPTASGSQIVGGSDASTVAGDKNGVSATGESLTAYTTAGAIGLLRTASAEKLPGTIKLGLAPATPGETVIVPGESGGSPAEPLFPVNPPGESEHEIVDPIKVAPGGPEPVPPKLPPVSVSPFASQPIRASAATARQMIPLDVTKSLTPIELPAEPAPDAAADPVPVPDLTPSPEVSSAVRIIATDVPPVPTKTVGEPTPTAPTEYPAVPGADNADKPSAAFHPDEAKIAAAAKYQSPPTREDRFISTQITDNKVLEKQDMPDGTGVAREADAVTATLRSPKEETGSSSLPKRSGNAPGVASAPGGAGKGAVRTDVIPGIAVSGATGAGATASQITATPAPEPTAARHAVKVEALLQTALSAGEGLRPNGQEKMEMRVRLGGGSEDVTVRLQVTNDRMQVTFQTDSPAMRKALEHGWEQFSASASRTSALTLATPRFETSPTSGFSQGTPTDSQAFSFNQQHSHRQDAPEPFADEAAPLVRTDRASVSRETAGSGQASTRRLNGWA